MKSLLFIALFFAGFICNAQEVLGDTEFIIDSTEETYDDTPFMVVENMPCMPKCAQLSNKRERDQCTTEEIINHVSQNAKYPQLAKEAGVSGIVFIQFVVGRTGEIEDVDVLRRVHPALDKESVRVVKSLPLFEPGTQLGKKVRVKYSIPVRFTLPKIEKEPAEKK